MKRQKSGEADPVGPVSQSITARPPFDPEAFARDTDSAIQLTGVSENGDLVPTVPPPPGLPGYPIDVKEPAADAGGRALTGETVPVLAVERSELDWFELPPQMLRLLAHVNGTDSVSTICATAGVALAEALTLLGELAREGLLTASPGTRA